jgi:arylamine N-acetyltransferase
MADMTLDLTDYFARIGYRGAADPTLDVLQDVITAPSTSLFAGAAVATATSTTA